MKKFTNLRVREIGRVMSTDDIIPGRYKHMFTDPKELAKHVFENALPGFAATISAGDVLCSCTTFGIGSSREQAVTSLLAAGVKAVIAPDFGRIFFRNSWNLGLVTIEADTVGLYEGTFVNIDLDGGRVHGNFGSVTFARPAQHMLEMIEYGGLLSLVVNQLKHKQLTSDHA